MLLASLHAAYAQYLPMCAPASGPAVDVAVAVTANYHTRTTPKRMSRLVRNLLFDAIPIDFLQFSVFGYGVSVLFFIFVVHFFILYLYEPTISFFSLFAAVVVAFAQGRRWLVLCLIIKKNRNDDVIVIIVVAAVEVVVSICIALRAFSHLAQLIAFYDHSFSMQSRPISRRIRAQVRLRIRFRI